MSKIQRTILTVLVIILEVCIASGCSEQEKAEFIFGTDLCQYDMYVESGNDIGINIPFAYNVSKDNIKLISVEGENIDTWEINLFDDTVEPCNKAVIDGYKLGYFGFIVEDCKKSFSVNKLNIEIAGQKETINFDTPLTVKICDNGEEMYQCTTADYIGGGGKNGLIYSFAIEEDITVTGYNFTSAYIIEEANVMAGNTEMMQLPYEIQKDEKLLFSLTTNTSKEDEYKFLGFNFEVEYMNEIGEECVHYVSVRQQAAGDEESCMEVLKLILKN